jgi:hypothetical protein
MDLPVSVIAISDEKFARFFRRGPFSGGSPGANQLSDLRCDFLNSARG